MKLRCLVVDDEPIAQEIIVSFIAKLEFLELAGRCSNALDAIHVIHSQTIDVLFLDIKMPVLSGIEMLNSLQNTPKVILTTAYSEFALESYDHGVSDYLLKPIAFDRFLKAVNKIVEQNKSSSQESTSEKIAEPLKFIFFKADKKIFKFYFHEILFFEGSGNYVKVFTTGEKPIMCLDKLNDIENNLSINGFVRIHKSFIVNISHIRQIEGNIIGLKQHELPISQTYREKLLKQLTQK